jgi:hypothetical protein
MAALKRKDYLSLLSKAKSPSRRKALISIADGQELKAIVECIINLSQGRIPIPESRIRQLKKYKNALRKLCEKSLSLKRKKQILTQHGGFLPLVLPFALKLLGNLF